MRINSVPKQGVRLLYTYNLNIKVNRVGPDSRQVLLPGRKKLGVPYASFFSGVYARLVKGKLELVGLSLINLHV